MQQISHVPVNVNYVCSQLVWTALCDRGFVSLKHNVRPISQIRPSAQLNEQIKLSIAKLKYK